VAVEKANTMKRNLSGKILILEIVCICLLHAIKIKQASAPEKAPLQAVHIGLQESLAKIKSSFLVNVNRMEEGQ
jgi:hypothetical protein